MVDPIVDLANFGVEPDWHEAPNDTVQAQARAAFRAIRSAVQEYRDQAGEAARNADLSDRGKKAAQQRAAAAALERLAQATVGPLATAQRKADRLAAGMKPRAADPLEVVARELRAQEIRRHVLERHQDTLTRGVVLNEALEKGDEATAEALLSAPAVFRMLEPDVAARGRQQLAERANPEVARELKVAVEAVTFAGQALEVARRQVQKDLGAAPNQIEVMATGGSDG